MTPLEQAIVANAIETWAGQQSPSGTAPPLYLLAAGVWGRFAPVGGAEGRNGRCPAIDLWAWQWICELRPTRRILIQGLPHLLQLLSDLTSATGSN